LLKLCFYYAIHDSSYFFISDNFLLPLSLSNFIHPVKLRHINSRNLHHKRSKREKGCCCISWEICHLHLNTYTALLLTTKLPCVPRKVWKRNPSLTLISTLQFTGLCLCLCVFGFCQEPGKITWTPDLVPTSGRPIYIYSFNCIAWV